MSLLANSNAIETGGYNIQRSLRFRSSASAYLNRTPASAGNRKTWTWSGWVKRGSLGGEQFLFAAQASDFALFFGSDQIRVWTNGGNGSIYTSAVYRDASAWYHIVLQRTSVSPYFNLYVNGNQVTAFAYDNRATYPGTADSEVNNTVAHTIGARSDATYKFDGYLAEVNFIDGQALTPSSFGQTDAVTGVWQPKKYTGTYGTNGFYLPFTDNTSATTLAYDKSGNGNNWTANNISTTAGATYDSMTDVPTLTSATAANYCVLNPLYGSPAPTNGNLDVSLSTQTSYGTISFTTGKWYWEVTVTAALPSSGYIGVMDSTYLKTDNNWSSQARSYINSGSKYDGSSSAYGASWTNGDVIGVAVDMSAGTIVFYKNGTSQGTAFSDLIGKEWRSLVYATTGSYAINFGQRPFSYTPPTGFKALNTFNLPDPTIKKPNQYMDAVPYTGTGVAQSIVNSGSFQPDLVWLKRRNGVGDNGLYDSVRGVSPRLVSNTTGAEAAVPIDSFNSNGFSTTANYNNSGESLMSWQWKAGGTAVTNTSGSITSTVSVNTTAGFSVVTYTGNNLANQSVGHGLGVAPSLVITKNRDISGSSSQWITTSSILGVDKYLLLNSTAAVTTASGYLPLPSSSVVYVSGANSGDNNAANKFVAYCWAQIPGFSKFGSYTGNGSADGPFVYCGFRPKYILVKLTSAAGEDWIVQDTARAPYNNGSTSTSLFPNSSAAEVNTAAQLWDVTSNGFKIRASGGGVNTNGATYIYAAFAENPFKYSLAR